GCHVGAGATGAPLLLFLNPDAEPQPGCLDVLRATAYDRPEWAAWQAVVTLPGEDRLNTRGGVVHWLGMGWADGCGQPAPPPAARAGGAAGGRGRVRGPPDRVAGLGLPPGAGGARRPGAGAGGILARGAQDPAGDRPAGNGRWLRP